MYKVVRLVVNEMTIEELANALLSLSDCGYSKDVLAALDGELCRRVDAWEDEARACYAEGRRVQGIKLCRQATGKGLKEALDYCDERFPRGDIIR